MASQGKGGKLKGAGFERKVSKQLTKWWQDGGLEGEFYRTPASGGLHWQKRSDVIGDICTPEGFRNTIECKNREDWNYKQFIEIGKSCKSGLYSWWEQSCREAYEANKRPWLILKKNFCKTLLVFSHIDDYSRIEANQSNKLVSAYIPTFKYDQWDKVHIILLEGFLEIAEPEVFLNNKG